MADDVYDPRFDPAFQRGFEGETSFPARQAPTRRAPVPAAELISAPPMTGAPMTGAQLSSAASARALDDGRPPVHGASFERSDVDVPPARLRGNPFLIALAVIGVVLILGGVIVGSRIDAWYEDVRPGGLGFNLLNMLVYGAPIAIALGVATIIGLLFVLALHWRGRSED